MSVEIWTLGGYSEIGRSMTAIGIDGEYVIIDIL